MDKRIWRWVAAVVLLTLVGAGGYALTQEDDTGDPAVIRYVNFRVYDPVYVAMDRGFFTDHGVEVQIIGDVLAGPTAIQAVAGGSAEAGLSSIPALINANAAGLPVYGVTDIQSALPGQPLELYFVRADSELQSVGDLSGTTFAVNLIRSSFHYTALLALEKAGVPDRYVEFSLLAFDVQDEALLNGDVDVIGLMEPYASALQQTAGDDVRILFDAIDIFGEKQFSLIFVNRIWARENPDSAKAFVAGIVDAIDWIESHQDEARAIIAQYTGIEESLVPDYHFQPGGRVIESDVAFWLSYLIDRGDVTAEWLTPDQIGGNIYHSQ